MSLPPGIDLDNVMQGKRSSSPSSSPPKSPRVLSYSESEAREVAAEWFRLGLRVEKVISDARNDVKGKPVSQSIDHRGHVPSDLGYHSVWTKYQGGKDPEFLCHRPRGAVPRVPLPLLYKPFADFTTNMHEGPVSEADLDFADDLLNELHSPEYVENHKPKVFDLQKKLSHYLGYHVASYPELVGDVKADGIHSLEKGGDLVGVLFLEWKAEAGKSGDPYFQALDYVRRAAALAPAFQTYALVVCVSGSGLEVTAASVEGDNKVWAEPLAETRCYGGMETTEKMARILRAIRLFVQDVHQAGALPRLPSPAIPPMLQGFNVLDRPFDDKLFFTFVNNGKREVAKFVPSNRYCEEAHRAWGVFAPELRKVMNVGAKWKAVRMEYLSPEEGWMSALDVVISIQHDEAAVGKLQSRISAAAEAGHRQRYVHGDMRLCNIMVRRAGHDDYEVKVVDFDWAGKDGQAVYPSRLNREVKWPEGAGYGALIHRSHDLYFANHLLEQLKPPVVATENLSRPEVRATPMEFQLFFAS